MSTPRLQGPALSLCLWQVRTGLSCKELARELGCARTTLSHWRSGKAKPSREVAHKLDKLSGGEISMGSWDEPTT